MIIPSRPLRGPPSPPRLQARHACTIVFVRRVWDPPRSIMPARFSVRRPPRRTPATQAGPPSHSERGRWLRGAAQTALTSAVIVVARHRTTATARGLDRMGSDGPRGYHSRWGFWGRTPGQASPPRRAFVRMSRQSGRAVQELETRLACGWCPCLRINAAGTADRLNTYKFRF